MLHNKASSKVAGDEDIREDNQDGNNDNKVIEKIKKDPKELIPELEAKIDSLKLENSRLKEQNNLVTDALTSCKSKEPEKKEIKNKEKLNALLEIIQSKLNELRNNIEAN